MKYVVVIDEHHGDPEVITADTIRESMEIARSHIARYHMELDKGDHVYVYRMDGSRGRLVYVLDEGRKLRRVK